MRRLGVWAILMLLLTAVALPAAAAPAISLSVQAANEGRVKQGSWVTVFMDLVNQGGDTEGEVVVEAAGDISHPLYVVPYTLSAGGRKRISVSVPNESNSPVAVKLYAEGLLLEERRVDLTWLPTQSVLAGVLSSDELGVPGISQMQASGGSAQVVRLAADNLPDQAALLADFDLIALSRFDTSTLSAAQLRALEVWVARGGTLLLAGGPEWKRTMGALPEGLVPVAVTDVREVSFAPLGDLAGTPLASAGSASVASVLRGQALSVWGDVPLVVSAPTGSGRVVYVAFDPGLTPIVDWQGQGALFSRLVGDAGQRNLIWGSSEWRIQQALQRIPDWGLPSVWTIGLLLLGYLALVGPVNYLVLRRLDRREWGWITVPALSLAFLGGVYLMGSGRTGGGISHLITLTEVLPETGTGAMTAHVGLYSPGRSQIAVTVPDAQLVNPFVWGTGGLGGVNARVTAGEQTTIELLGVSNFSMSGFSMRRDLNLTGGLELVDARVENGTLTARLRNGLDVAVDGIEVATGQQTAMVGLLEPGQTSEPFTLEVGVGDFGSWVGKPGMGIEPWLYEQTPDPRRGEMRASVVEAVSHRLPGALLVVGWTAEPLSDPGLPDLGKLEAGANLVYSVLSLPASEDGDIPAGMILGRPNDANEVKWTPTGYYVPDGTHLFTLFLPPLEADKVAEFTLDLQSDVGVEYMSVSVKNQQTGEWLPLTGRRTALPDWQAFVSPGGLIELQYLVRVPLDVQAPTVAVKGVAR